MIHSLESAATFKPNYHTNIHTHIVHRHTHSPPPIDKFPDLYDFPLGQPRMGTKDTKDEACIKGLWRVGGLI